MQIKPFTGRFSGEKIFAIELSSDHERRLRELVKVFLEENKKLNLSAYREEEQCWIGNVMDSVFGNSQFTIPQKILNSQFQTPKKVIDVGMGGGFPVLPLAILFPEIKFTGLDATGKKVDAVKRICKKMKIGNVDFVTGRAEELGHDIKYREKFDVALARAVAPLSALLEYMSPFAKLKGHLLCWKGMNISDELTGSVNARIKLNAQLVDKVEYELPEGWGKRQVLVFEKTGYLPSNFPRGAGIAKKKPL